MQAGSSTLSADGLIEVIRRLAIVPSLLALLIGGLTLRAELPSGISLLVIAAAFAGAWRLPRSDYRLFVLHITGFLLFNTLRVFADTTGNPVNFAYPISVDHSIFGSVPTVWLQEHLYRAGHIGVVDTVAMGVYLSYFKAHFIFGAIVWATKRQYLGLYVGMILTTLALGLVGYYLLPTAPPWLAAENGHLPEITRIFHQATSQLWHEANQNGSYIAGTNDVAAMPSLHTALTMAIALMMWRINRALGVLGFVYVAAMGFSLMYLGEHYFVDVAAGVITAMAAMRITERLASKRASVPILAVQPSGTFVLSDAA